MKQEVLKKLQKKVTGNMLQHGNLRRVKGSVAKVLKEAETKALEKNAVSMNEVSTNDIEDKTSELEQYLAKRYELRFNLLTEQTEYRDRTLADSPYQPLSRREENSLFIRLEKEDINCKERVLARYLHSSYIPPYHPFHLYMDGLPSWDGQDRLADLAHRISSDTDWIHNFHRWMLGVAAQWMGVESKHANSTAPLLISEEQGWMKSTFCKSLMPQPLKDYYTDQLDVSQGQQERKLATMGLINLDEFDRLSPRQMASLKNLMQLTALSIRKAYRQHYQQLPRIASFIGTSNRKDLLTDPTGSRRFICVQVEQSIDCTGIDHDQIYAQLKHELHEGKRYWFTHEEEALIQQHNQAFYRLTPEEELFQAHFRAAQPDEEGELVSLDQIIDILQKKHKGVLRSLNLSRFGAVLVATGVERIHTVTGNRYHVVRIK